MGHRTFFWDPLLSSPSRTAGSGYDTAPSEPAELSGHTLSSTLTGKPVRDTHLGGTVLARGTEKDLVPGRIVELSWDQMKSLDERLRPESSRVSMLFPGDRMAWVYIPVTGLEPHEPSFHDLNVALDESTSTLTSPPRVGDDLILIGKRARAGRRAAENLWSSARTITVRVRHLMEGWGPGGVGRIEGLVRHGDWLLPVMGFIRIGTVEPFEGFLEVVNTPSYAPAASNDLPSSQLYSF